MDSLNLSSLKINNTRNTRNSTRNSTRDSTRDNVEIIDGDLLEIPSGTKNYIVQQCCCICTKPAGLSAAIATKWKELNPYKDRKPIGRRHTATLETRDKPGTASLLTSGDVKLISLFAQYSPGKPKTYKDEFEEVVDTAVARRNYFQQSLLAMKDLIKNHSNLYFPYGIGCGLAGGKWELYEKMIRDFAKENPQYNIIIVKK
jgi:hypothetical protein